MAINTLADIQTKVRRLTRSPSTAQLSPLDLNNYINTFVLYDFPEHLRTFNLRQQFTFYTNPFQDVYKTDRTLLSTNPLYDFQNRYLTIHPPVYIAGFEAFYTQSREQFFNIYPKINQIQSIGVTGNAVTTSFSGAIQNFGNATPANQTTPILQNQVLFSSVDLNDQGLALIDQPILDATTLNPTNFGLLYVPSFPPAAPLVLAAPYQTAVGFPTTNFINYVTGQFTITFPSAPGNGQTIDSQSVPYQPTLPQALCFYQDHFIVRPVPDQPYRVNFEVYKQPTELLSTDQMPDLAEWWQYIALGASIKIFQDRFDFDSVNLIMPEFKVQQNLCNRRSLVQYTNERPATIYTETTELGNNGGWGWGNGLGGY